MDEVMSFLQVIDTFGVLGLMSIMLIAERRRADAAQQKIDLLYSRIMDLHLGELKVIESLRREKE